MKNRRGFTLLASLFIMLIMGLLAMTTSTFISSDAVVASRNYYSLDAFGIACSGVEYYLKDLSADDDWSTPPTPPSAKSFSDGSFSITPVYSQKNWITFTSAGLLAHGLTNYRRTILVSIQRTGEDLGWIAEDYVIYSGADGESGDCHIGNNSVINGNVYINGNLDIGSNVVIDGIALATGEITGDLTGLSITPEAEFEPNHDPPTLDNTYYEDLISDAAGHSEGDLVFDPHQTHNISGTYYVNGNVLFDIGSTVNLTGTATIVATGIVTVNNDVVIDDGLTVIAGGLVTFWNNITVGRFGLWYSSVGFVLKNNQLSGQTEIGEGTIFLTPGDVDMGNNCNFAGLIYAGGEMVIGNNVDFEGLIIAGHVADIGENSTFQFNPDVVNWDLVIGLGGGGGGRADITKWIEIY